MRALVVEGSRDVDRQVDEPSDRGRNGRPFPPDDDDRARFDGVGELVHADRRVVSVDREAGHDRNTTPGPLERFKVMVRNPVYGPMINHRSAEYENVRVEDDFAQVDAILQSKDGQYLGYRFMLSRQRGNEYEGSWMTDAVYRFDVVSL